MAAKKKKATKKKATGKRSKGRGIRRASPAAAPIADLRKLDAGWRNLVETSAPDVPLTELWPVPKGAPSTKTTIRLATKKKAVRKTAKKKANKKAAKKK